MQSSRQTIGIVGAVVLALGVFAPIVRLPLVGDVNYFSNGNGEGAVVLVLAVAAGALVLTERYRLVLVPAGLSLGMIVYRYVDIQRQLHDARVALERVGNLLEGLGGSRGLGGLAVKAVQFQWGWVVLLAGVALLGVAALMPEQGKPAAPPTSGGPDGIPPGPAHGA
ncbi:MAG TPA: hypothetical protein VII47_06865 [Actinomycetota bacterium]